MKLYSNSVKMIHVEVDSSALLWFEFDPKEKLLLVEYTHGGTRYAYEGVPDDVFQGLLAAPSAGAYFSKNIRDVYEFQKIPGQLPEIKRNILWVAFNWLTAKVAR